MKRKMLKHLASAPGSIPKIESHQIKKLRLLFANYYLKYGNIWSQKYPTTTTIKIFRIIIVIFGSGFLLNYDNRSDTTIVEQMHQQTKLKINTELR